MALIRERLDKLLVERGLVASRERARALIMEGKVKVDGHPVTKAGEMVISDAQIDLKGEDMPYVSRGGLKLEAALKHFEIFVQDKVAMDVGASTGGFTDVMLQKGVRRVYCIDVGYGQLAWKLRQDPRVVLLERTNIRSLERQRIPESIDIATIDVSFISLNKVIPKVLEFISDGGEIVALIKPQFEVGKGEVGKGGIVKDSAKRHAAVERVRNELQEFGLHIMGIIESPILGQKGNMEYLIHCIRELA
ncbi:MAG: TlyA family RNA methyltransferase [Dissulfurispiraceae bacterium]|jgi:23S rRNA (cytidine1920-2'-O)/16S rRNA (cytidine1409-2'-O)-methyltransferase